MGRPVGWLLCLSARANSITTVLLRRLCWCVAVSLRCCPVVATTGVTGVTVTETGAMSERGSGTGGVVVVAAVAVGAGAAAGAGAETAGTGADVWCAGGGVSITCAATCVAVLGFVWFALLALMRPGGESVTLLGHCRLARFSWRSCLLHTPSANPTQLPTQHYCACSAQLDSNSTPQGGLFYLSPQCMVCKSTDSTQVALHNKPPLRRLWQHHLKRRPDLNPAKPTSLGRNPGKPASSGLNPV